MGCFSSQTSTTTQQATTIPKPTQQELDMMQLTIDALLPAYLDSMGYVVEEAGADTTASGTAGSKFKDSDIYSSLPKAGGMAGGSSGAGFTKNSYTYQRGDLSGGIIAQPLSPGEAKGVSLTQGGEGSGVVGTYTGGGGGGKKYKISKKPPPDVAYAMEKYGKDSSQYKEAYDKWKKSEVEKYESQQDIDRLVMENTEKFLKGDFSLNEGQKKFLNDAFAPIKDASLKAIQYLKDEANNMEGNLGKAINGFKDEVAKTGMGMGDAITVLENRIKQTGVNMKSALQEEVGFTRKLNEMGLKDFTTDQRLKLQNQAVALGRSSTDPDFQLAMQTNVNKEIERSNLALGEYSANKRLSIEERTGAGLEEAAKLRLGVAERTGQGMEEGARMKYGAATEAEGLRMKAADLMAQTELGLAESKANAWKDLVMGLPPSQIGTGMNVGQYQNALLQQRVQNLGSAMQAPLNIYNTLAANRYAQPSTTGSTTQKSTPSIASMITGAIGAGLSGVGAAYGAGWLG